MAVYERQGPTQSAMSKGLSSGLIGAFEDLTNSKIKEIDRQRVAQGLQGIGFEEQEAQGLSKLPSDLQKEVVKDQFTADREGRKSSQKTVTDIVNSEKASRDNLATLNRIEELDKKGNVQGITGQLLSKVGLGRFRNADTQELEKLSQQFLNNLKNVFGSRPTNLDVTNYLKSIPTLANSPAGRARVIKNLRLYNEAAQLRGQALRDILKENKGRPPNNLDLVIEDRIGTQLDQLAGQISDSGSADQEQSQTFESLPNPSQYAGKTIRDNQTGQLIKSDGSRWIPQQG